MKTSNSLWIRDQEQNPGEVGAPRVSGNNNEASTTSAKAFAEDLRRRAAHPLSESDEYKRVVAECVAAHEARRKPSKFALSSFDWNPHLAAAILVVLLILSTILWVGCRVTIAAPLAVGGHTAAISRELSE